MKIVSFTPKRDGKCYYSGWQLKNGVFDEIGFSQACGYCDYHKNIKPLEFIHFKIYIDCHFCVIKCLRGIDRETELGSIYIPIDEKYIKKIKEIFNVCLQKK